MWEPTTNLSLLANASESFKGLPQEIVDEIFDYLEGHWQALIVCSLTCKGLYLSARRIIHRQLYVVGPRYRYKATNHSQLSMLSAAAQCGLSQYTRKLTIRVRGIHTRESPATPPTISNVLTVDLYHTPSVRPTPIPSGLRTILRSSNATNTVLGIYVPTGASGRHNVLHMSVSEPRGPGIQPIPATQLRPFQRVRPTQHSELAYPRRYPASHRHEPREDQLFRMSH